MMLPTLADLLQLSQTEIVNAWIEAVRGDPRIHSDEDLSDHGLRNHVPFIVEEICGLLRVNQSPQAANTREARVHVYTRYRQGYRARDLVCEISLLRLQLLDAMAEHMLSQSSSGKLKTYVEATRIVNRYIDEELRYAISVYTESERPAGSEPGDEAEKGNGTTK